MATIYRQPPSQPHDAHDARESVGLRPHDRLDKETLRTLLAGSFGKEMNRTLGRLIAREEAWDAAMELVRSGEERIAFRASWALEWAYTLDPRPVEERFPGFLEDLLRSDHASVQRIYSKMLCDMMRRGAVAPDDTQAAALAGKCGELLLSQTAPVAVRVWQIELLDDLRGRIGWVEENLTDIVREVSERPDCPPAMATCARRYLQRANTRNKRR